MEKSVTKILNLDRSKGTGFFCKIPLSDKNDVHVLISNYHEIKE